METNDVEAEARPPRSGLKFPGAVTTLAIVTVLVWLAALFIPPGRYQLDDHGAPIPGTYERTASPLSTADTLRQLVLSPVNGVYGLRNPDTGFIDTEKGVADAKAAVTAAIAAHQLAATVAAVAAVGYDYIVKRALFRAAAG